MRSSLKVLEPSDFFRSGSELGECSEQEEMGKMLKMGPVLQGSKGSRECLAGAPLGAAQPLAGL